MADVIGFHPTPKGERIITAPSREGESTSDVLRTPDYESWLDQARSDAERLQGEDLTTEPEAW